MKDQEVFIITGKQGEGKSTKLMQVVNELKTHGVFCKGFIAEGEWKNGFRSSFSIKDLSTSKSYLLCSAYDKPGFEQIGRFFFSPETMAIGKQVLTGSNAGEILVVDEIGLFELKGKVWGEVLEDILKKNINPLLITVRDKFLNEVISNFNIEEPKVFGLDTDVNKITSTILAQLSI